MAFRIRLSSGLRPIFGLLLITLWVRPGHDATADAVAPGWERQEIHDRFFTEGASAGDLDGDGHLDIVAGPLCFRGPDFQQRFRIAPAKEFPVEVYSDQFFSHVADVTGDGAADVLVIGFPGKPARLYVNPNVGPVDQDWPVHEITGPVDNESPAIIDLIPGGNPEIVCGNASQYGYYQSGDDATKPWTWTPISRPGSCPNRFTHGMGVGDVDGDGRLDVVGKSHWWRQPTDDDAETLWTAKRWNDLGNYPGGSQICVNDVDGDGDSDIVTSLHAHGYGLAWFENRGGDIFTRHDIMGESSQDNPYGVAFSQLHAVAMADVDRDGIKDIVTGKRFMAHRGKDIGGLQPPVLVWFRCVRDESSVEFIPHMIDDDSGVGVDVLVTDLNADSWVDVVSSSKHGLTVHLRAPDTAMTAEPKWQVAEGRDQSKYVEGFTPQQAAENMIVPPGFEVDLIAGEPDLTQPIAMCFDARGRIWVIEGHTYPNKAPAGQGRDRVVIFADNDSDGTFESKSTFIEGINLASAIEVGFGGVWIGAAPELLFIPDADHDGTPDGDPVVLLDGWGHQDTHETLNSFTWGPDGWLYGCHGVFTHSKVGKPGTPEDQRVRLNAGVWRYHPTRHEFDVFAHGTSNPWGVDFNDEGEWFISACVIPHLYHLSQGGRYQRQAGRHFNPYTYDDIKTIADHAHFAGRIQEHAYWGENKTTRPPAAMDTSILGGGHAHCGLAIYDGDVFPPQYRGDLFFHNLHGHRIVREKVERDGSGYVGRHRPDFALSQDHYQVGVGIMVGPDGALYTSDWHDVQTCHHRDPEIWDRTNGRLFRIRYGDAQGTSLDLWSSDTSQLIRNLDGTNGFVARQSARILQERHSDGVLDLSDEQIVSLHGQMATAEGRRRAVWLAGAILGSDANPIDHWIQDADPVIRRWAIHHATQQSDVTRDVAARIAEIASTEPNASVRRKIASSTQKIAPEQRLPILRSLAKHTIDANDRNLPWLFWYAMEPLVQDHPNECLEIAMESQMKPLPDFVIRRTAETADGRQSLTIRLTDPKQRGLRLTILQRLLDASISRGGIEMPAAWPAAMDALADAPNAQVQRLARNLAVQLGDATVLPHFREVLADTGNPAVRRQQALQSLMTAGDPELADQLHRLLDDAAIRDAALGALGQLSHPGSADEIIARFDQFPAETQTIALSALVTRIPNADRLVAAMESGDIDPRSVPAYVVRQIIPLAQRTPDSDLLSRLENVWGKVGRSDAEMQQQFKRYQAILTPRGIASADARLGRKLYEANCGKCHRLFGEGGQIGPDITGANRSDVRYWLENILDPNALIGRDYRMTNFLLLDGRIIGGIVRDENDDAVTVQTAEQQVVIPKDEIEERIESDVSLMPVGQLEPMSENDVRSLLKYLMGPGQVPLP
ncbi:PVC-type heme-binding CxxCH protein [Crateriforma spongiae]|uniref:PVC-type heme-binding CxxCH protein n=1 Tax=Crateriforma spongiae TaxID=2724528 RepID=UPI0014454E13|nr:PVC-type heme-binding CxxCH protein [Crateriforma spongiae]